MVPGDFRRGHERDLGALTSDADDLDYMHARFYNGQLARFLSVDRLQGSPYRPQSLNRCAYVLGSPINFVDPWGLEATCSGTVCGETITVTARRNPLDDYFDGIDASRPGGGGGSWFVTRLLGGPNGRGGQGFGSQLGVSFAAFFDGLVIGGDPFAAFGLYDPGEYWVAQLSGELFPAIAGSALTYGAGGPALTAGKPAVVKAVSTAVGRESVLFKRGGLLNSNRYLRVGWGQHQGRHVFRVSGDVVGLLKRGSPHWDLWTGPRR